MYFQKLFHPEYYPSFLRTRICSSPFLRFSKFIFKASHSIQSSLSESCVLELETLLELGEVTRLCTCSLLYQGPPSPLLAPSLLETSLFLLVESVKTTASGWPSLITQSKSGFCTILSHGALSSAFSGLNHHLSLLI